jgi:hypothetical protein
MVSKFNVYCQLVDTPHDGDMVRGEGWTCWEGGALCN